MTAFRRLVGMILLMTRGREVGRVALNRQLFFADMACFLAHGRTMSGATYLCAQSGPAPSEVAVARQALIQSGYLTEIVKTYDVYCAFAYRAIDDNVEFEKVRAEFSADEQHTIETSAREVGRMAAIPLSEAICRFEPWVSADPEAPLDFERARTDLNLIDWLSTWMAAPERRAQ